MEKGTGNIIIFSFFFLFAVVRAKTVAKILRGQMLVEHNASGILICREKQCEMNVFLISESVIVPRLLEIAHN